MKKLLAVLAVIVLAGCSNPMDLRDDCEANPSPNSCMVS